MSIRWHSTVESVNNGEIAVLAIVEAAIAVSLTLFIAVKYQTLIHIAISASIAPLLLLRTRHSTKRGLRWLLGTEDALAAHWPQFLTAPIAVAIVSAPLSVLASVIVVPLSTAINIVATIYTTCRHPLCTIRTIPDNWKRLVLCTDSCYPPEFIPGLETQRSDNPRLYKYTFNQLTSWIFKYYRLCTSESGFVLFYINMMPIAMCVFLPPLFGVLVTSLLYRWSLKSTSIVYFAFVWIVNSSLSVQQNVYNRLHSIVKLAYGKFIFFFSLFWVFVSLLKAYLFIWTQSILM